jgi:hypothetical protein
MRVKRAEDQYRIARHRGATLYIRDQSRENNCAIGAPPFSSASNSLCQSWASFR